MGGEHPRKCSPELADIATANAHSNVAGSIFFGLLAAGKTSGNSAYVKLGA